MYDPPAMFYQIARKFCSAISNDNSFGFYGDNERNIILAKIKKQCTVVYIIIISTKIFIILMLLTFRLNVYDLDMPTATLR